MIFQYEMEAVLIRVNKKSDIAFLLGLAQRMGMSARTYTKSQIEDLTLAVKIEKGMKTATVSRMEVLKALRK